MCNNRDIPPMGYYSCNERGLSEILIYLEWDFPIRTIVHVVVRRLIFSPILKLSTKNGKSLHKPYGIYTIILRQNVSVQMAAVE